MSDSNKQGLFVEVHALVSHAPSNLNRDDLGAPKTAVFGGVRRLRISSQCLKRSWRTSPVFVEQLGSVSDRLGERTAALGAIVQEQLPEKLSGDELGGFNEFLRALGKGKSGKSKEQEDEEAEEDGDVSEKTSHLLYLSHDEQKAVAEWANANRSELAKLGAEAKKDTQPKTAEEPGKEAKGKAEKAKTKRPKKDSAEAEAGKAKEKNVESLRKTLASHLKSYVPSSAVDVALFGRFLTKSEFREIDGAMQVAHALGTQKAEIEYDYFTAVDDRSTEAAAGHIGETELGASVFYKYAVCDMERLRKNLGPGEEERKQGDKDEAVKARVENHEANARDVAAETIRAILHAVARVVPTGKKNSTAPQNPADYVEVVIRRDAPVSLANAFLRPVSWERDRDVMDLSIQRLRQQAKKYDEMYGLEGVVMRLCLSSRPIASTGGTKAETGETDDRAGTKTETGETDDEFLLETNSLSELATLTKDLLLQEMLA